ncbi:MULTISPECIES: V-type ATP synthase subunit F [Clostridium]|jgi:V/A-type H+-transporting ATPase subunit F|uniref:Vacuolar H+transporting two-sector ATPase F subunit n=3 Tax=Clostridium intestinale TaxID=36845 RepID=U2PTI7_9CLOT|nr:MULTISPECIES: V-type ATP synthase subunit F [Clostridium]ERK29765.1 Vacuolar H+transporting two-sector ATPase F subunit [Clostridium intestinale URNW]QLY81165.1 V-type ATP synthase subunit F [Clostridium intestinale]WRY51934.1 V-type ATP synthase subunit F [Clostridium intestinale]SHH90792.1 V/A-type H+-transporting ATPase subunit F [Clostridium intestinale DSM 6191]
MRSFLISDNRDTLIGMKMAGIDGVIIRERQEVIEKIEELKKTDDIGIIIITEKISLMVNDYVYKLKLSKDKPLIIEIPDRHGSNKGQDSILRYIKESIGLKI